MMGADLFPDACRHQRTATNQRFKLPRIDPNILKGLAMVAVVMFSQTKSQEGVQASNLIFLCKLFYDQVVNG